MVIGTIQAYDAAGNDTLAGINEMESASPTYPFVLDAETLEVVAEGAYPEVAGLTALFLRDTGVPIESILHDLESSGGVWATYAFHNPATDIEQIKRSWLSQHDGYIFGSGYYLSADAETQSAVRAIVRAYETVGADAFATLDGYAKHDLTIPFVLDAETFQVVAHGGESGNLTSNLGWSMLRSWVGDQMLPLLKETGNRWISYKVPVSLSESQYVRAWVSLRDGYVIGAAY